MRDDRERLLDIVDAAGRIAQQRYPGVPWRAGAGMRNRVIHGYFDLDLEVVWTTAERDVPALATSVRAITTELEGQVGDGNEQS